MNAAVMGAAIGTLRKEKGITQAALAAAVGVSSKTVSKWETGKGLPDITLLAPLAKALEVSVAELMAGSAVVNRNTACNMLRTFFHVCPLCGNIIHSTGAAVISCCGAVLPPLQAQGMDALHPVCIEPVEDEHFVTVQHEMTRSHYISFLAYVTDDRVWLTKLYPEGNAETRFRFRGGGYLYLYCNVHGLMRQKLAVVGRRTGGREQRR